MQTLKKGQGNLSHNINCEYCECEYKVNIEKYFQYLLLIIYTKFVRQDRKFVPGFLRFHDARRPKMSKYSHRCCFPAWGIMGSSVISTSTPVMSTTTSVSVWKEKTRAQVYDKRRKLEIKLKFVSLFCAFLKYNLFNIYLFFEYMRNI